MGQEIKLALNDSVPAQILGQLRRSAHRAWRASPPAASRVIYKVVWHNRGPGAASPNPGTAHVKVPRARGRQTVVGGQFPHCHRSRRPRTVTVQSAAAAVGASSPFPFSSFMHCACLFRGQPMSLPLVTGAGKGRWESWYGLGMAGGGGTEACVASSALLSVNKCATCPTSSACVSSPFLQSAKLPSFCCVCILRSSLAPVRRAYLPLRTILGRRLASQPQAHILFSTSPKMKAAIVALALCGLAAAVPDISKFPACAVSSLPMCAAGPLPALAGRIASLSLRVWSRTVRPHADTTRTHAHRSPASRKRPSRTAAPTRAMRSASASPKPSQRRRPRPTTASRRAATRRSSP